MEVFDVSANGETDITTGILSPSTMNGENPTVYLFLQNTGADYAQFDDGNANVIVKRESAEKFDSGDIR